MLGYLAALAAAGAIICVVVLAGAMAWVALEERSVLAERVGHLAGRVNWAALGVIVLVAAFVLARFAL